MLVLAGCGANSSGLTDSSTCADLLKADEPTAARYMQAKLTHYADHGPVDNADVLAALDATSYNCAGSPDRTLGSFPWGQSGSSWDPDTN